MTSDAGLLLLSGGIDSPVAGHLVRAQGHPLEAVHFSLVPFTEDEPEVKARALADRIGVDPLHVVPLGEASAALAQADHHLYFVLSKRLMVRTASRLARERGLSFLVTGENLGQVSSQTLGNLTAIDRAADLPVVRPLLGWDKQEIIAEAKALGTFDVSVGPEHCDALGPERPETWASMEAVEAAEARLDVEALVEQALAGVRTAAAPRPEATL